MTSEADEPIVDECDACGADVVEGTVHDCPVLGAPVTVTRTRSGSGGQPWE